MEIKIERKETVWERKRLHRVNSRLWKSCGRAAFSFVLIGLVMLLRKVAFSRRTFIRGLLWSSFLSIPFLGKLKPFYENAAVLRMT